MKKARDRVRELIAIIQGLRKEIREAREALVIANNENLHVSLVEVIAVGDPSLWDKGEELKEAP